MRLFSLIMDIRKSSEQNSLRRRAVKKIKAVFDVLETQCDDFQERQHVGQGAESACEECEPEHFDDAMSDDDDDDTHDNDDSREGDLVSCLAGWDFLNCFVCPSDSAENSFSLPPQIR